MALVTVQCCIDLSYYFPPEAVVRSKSESDGVLRELLRLWKPTAWEVCAAAFEAVFNSENEEDRVSVSKVTGVTELFLTRHDKTQVHVHVSSLSPMHVEVVDRNITVHAVELVQTAYSDAFLAFERRISKHYAANGQLQNY